MSHENKMCVYSIYLFILAFFTVYRFFFIIKKINVKKFLFLSNKLKRSINVHYRKNSGWCFILFEKMRF